MKGINRVQLVGNLGQDAELVIHNDQPFLVIKVATSESYKDKDGVLQSWTEWHKVIVKGKRATALHPLLKKGRGVFIEGQLRTRTWSCSDDKVHSSPEIHLVDIWLPRERTNVPDSSPEDEEIVF